MEGKKLEIKAKKYRGDSAVVSLRLPTDLIAKLDSISKETGRTRNDIMQTCREFAVDNLEITIGANEAKNVFRKDEVKRFEDVDSLLANAPTQDQHMFKLPKVLN